MKTRGVSQSKSQEWNWGLGRDPGVSTNRAPEDLLRLVPPSAQQWHPCAQSVLFSTQVAVARPQALPPSPLTELQALARSTLESLLVSVSKTFIFSTRHVRAVSVASPTFS